MNRKLGCILLVDDDPATHFLHNRVINKLNCAEKTATVYNGLEALDFLKKQIDEGQSAPDLILLDINMPLVNAWEFLDAYSRFTEQQKGKAVIVMVTTSLNPDDQLRAKTFADVKGFCLKPLDKEMMLQILDAHF